MARRCLYYPFIHFRDEAWLKLSALYWDDVTRIVPRSFAPQDNREVRALEEAEVVKRVDPSPYEAPVAKLFELLLRRHRAGLVRRYDIQKRETWPENLDRIRVKAGRVSSKTLAFIHRSKLEPSLVEQLFALNLAVPSHDDCWLGMHPAIVSAYMIALAAEISRRRGLAPISANVTHLGGITSCSVDDLARSLVGDVDLSRRRRPPPEPASAKLSSERVAFVTLRMVLPQQLEGVPAKRIVQLRGQHASARHAFHGYVDDLRARLSSEQIADADALDEHIRLEYEKRLKPELHGLQRGLRSLGIGSVLGSVGVAIALPLGSVLGGSPAAALAASATAGVGLAALAQRQRESARSLLGSSPASFLFMTRQLRPSAFAERLSSSLRRFTLGV